VLDDHSPCEAIEQAARHGRIWMVCHPPSTDTTLWDTARENIESFGSMQVNHRRFVHLDLGIYSPPAVAMLANTPAGNLASNR
jgi:hypothetical protein